MTKSNKFANAIVALRDSKTFNEANKKKIAKLILLANNRATYETLIANNVDSKRFDARALYATEKCVKFAHAMSQETVSAADIEKNVFAVMKTATNAAAAKEAFTKADIESALLASCKVSEERAHIVFQRANKIDAAAQVQQCIDVLKTMSIVTETARNVFTTTDSAILQQFAEKFAQQA